MKLQYKQTILYNHIKEVCGKNDYILISNNYSIVINDLLDYVSIIEMVIDEKEKGYWFNELFLEGEKVYTMLGKNFFKNSKQTQLKKARYIISEYMYY